MTQKPLIKREIVYKIETTDEIEAMIYVARKIEILGAFVKFRPFQCISKYKEPVEMKDVILILPERVIAQITVKRLRSIKPS